MNKKYIAGILIGTLISTGLISILGNKPSTENRTTVIVNKYEPAPNINLNVAATNSVDVTRIEIKPEQAVYINTEINEMSVALVIKQLIEREKTGQPIYLLIDSPGGSVLDGAQIVSFIETSKVPIYTVCTKMCASMAAIIHQHGKERYSLDRSVLMFHPASGGARGQVENMRSLLNMVSRLIKKFDSYIINRSKMDQATYNNLVAYELWLDGEDSLKLGFVDKLVSIRMVE